MKKLLALVLVAVLALGMVPAVLAEAAMPKIGVAIYKFDDTFMTGVRNAIEEAAKDVAEISMADSLNQQPTQNDQVTLFIGQEMNALAINPVDRTACPEISKKAQEAGIPVVYFNREPIADEMVDFTDWYYVGAKAEESGTMSGELIADYFAANPDKLGDDGVLQYVMLQGEPGHQDAELRTEYSLKALADAGMKVENLATDTAMWNRVNAQDKMAAWLTAYGDKIEAVLANNDDMALGAIEALKAAGYFVDGKYIPVVGVDATAPALEALKEGTLLGTVLNDAKNQGRATLMLAVAAAQGKVAEFAEYEMVDEHYVWVPYQKVTIDNYTQFE